MHNGDCFIFIFIALSCSSLNDIFSQERSVIAVGTQKRVLKCKTARVSDLIVKMVFMSAVGIHVHIISAISFMSTGGCVCFTTLIDCTVIAGKTVSGGIWNISEILWFVYWRSFNCVFAANCSLKCFIYSRNRRNCWGNYLYYAFTSYVSDL